MRATILQPSGNLLLTADNALRAGLKYAYEEGGYYAAESLMCEMLREGCTITDLDMVRPEDIGALTDAPIIAYDCGRKDDDSFYVHGDIWWFPDYVIRDPFEELKNRGRVVFQLAPKD